MSKEQESVTSAQAAETARAMRGLDEFSSRREEIERSLTPDTPPETPETQAANTEQNTPPAETPPAQAENPAQTPDTDSAPTPPLANEQEETNEGSQEDVVTSVIFGDKNLNETPATEANEGHNEINSIEDFDAFLKEVGIEDRSGLKTKIDAWKEAETKLAETSEQLTGIDNQLKSLSPEVFAIMKADLEGKDWREIATTAPQIDFKKTADEIETKQLIDAYFPGKFSEEDWEEFNAEDGDPNVKKAIDAVGEVAKTKHTSQRNEYINSVQAGREKAEKFQQDFISSLQTANDYLKREMPGIDEGYLSKLNEKITKEGIVSHFYNEDGTLKETAALAFLRSTQDYEDLVQARINIAVKNAKNQKTQEVLDRGADKPNHRGKTNSGQNVIRKEVQEKIEKDKELFR